MKYLVNMCLAGLCLVGSAMAETIYVAQDGSGDHTSVQSGIDAASNGDTVVIRAGLYVISSSITPSGKAILVIGELDGSGDLAVTLDGGNAKRVIKCDSGESDTQFENLIIANGYAEEWDGGYNVGGGVLIANTSDVSFVNCSFLFNDAVGDDGGAMNVRPGSRVVLDSCLFSGNTATDSGGAIECQGELEMSNCVVLSNSSSRGGGVTVFGTTSIINGCMIANNNAANGGGIYVSGGSAEITDCHIYGNTVSSQGGGIRIQSSDTTVISNCELSNNNATIDGGGMYCYESDIQLTDNVISSNNCPDGHGGGIRFYSSSPNIVNCDIIDNTSGIAGAIQQGGGGLYFHVNCDPFISGCLISGNVAAGNGGGILAYSGCDVSIVDCQILGNSAATGGGLASVGGMMDVNGSSVLSNAAMANANGSGGGIAYLSTAQGVIEDCQINLNTAAKDGGALYVESNSTASMANSFICGNQSGSGEQITGDVDQSSGGNTIAIDCLVDDDGDGVDEEVDNCNLYNPEQLDCNGNGIGDVCDLAYGTSQDCDANGIPDECESLPDCDGDGVADVCEVANGALDSNPADGIPDECQGLALGACCIGFECVPTTLLGCASGQGTYYGDGVACADAVCPLNCPGDVSGDGQVGIVDLLTVIDGWGFCP